MCYNCFQCCCLFSLNTQSPQKLTVELVWLICDELNTLTLKWTCCYYFALQLSRFIIYYWWCCCMWKCCCFQHFNFLDRHVLNIFIPACTTSKNSQCWPNFKWILCTLYEFLSRTKVCAKRLKVLTLIIIIRKWQLKLNSTAGIY